MFFRFFELLHMGGEELMKGSSLQEGYKGTEGSILFNKGLRVQQRTRVHYVTHNKALTKTLASTGQKSFLAVLYSSKTLCTQTAHVLLPLQIHFLC